MKTKLLTLFLALVAGAGTMFAWDDYAIIGDYIYNFDTSNQTAEVCGASNSSNITTADIPASVTYNDVEYSVISIGNGAFHRCEKLTTVKIPNSVTSIGEEAFRSSSKITSVTIGDGVLSIGDDAFRDCDRLPFIEIPNSVISIGEDVFNYCTGLKSVTFGNSVASIGDRAFRGCSGLTSLTLPNSVTTIGYRTFDECRGLTSVTLGNGVTSIGGMAFAYCGGLTSITIPNSVTSIGGGAFAACYNLTSIDVATNHPNYCSVDGVLFSKDKTTLVQYPSGKQGTYTIPNSVTDVQDGAFLGCTGLTEPLYNEYIFAFMPPSYSGAYIIPDGIESIVGSAFYYCYDLTSVTIPNSVTYIGRSAFAGCTGLTSLALPNSVTSIGDEAFSGCRGLTSFDIPSKVTTIGLQTFYSCYGLTSVTIPNGVTCIGDLAFSYCGKLSSVTIPCSVTSIGKGAFEDCRGLTSITCEAVNPPVLGAYSVFGDVDKSIPLYVLTGSVEAYKTADIWSYFTNILPLAAEQTEVTELAIEPGVTSAEIVWPIVTGAASYDIVIKDANDNVICTLTFNEQGQLTNITYNAPARNSESQQTQSAGFAFTVTGLEPGMQYSYSIIAKNESGATLNTETGTFNTKSLEAMENTAAHNKVSRKILRNGQVLILRGNHTYTLTGQELK